MHSFARYFPESFQAKICMLRRDDNVDYCKVEEGEFIENSLLELHKGLNKERKRINYDIYSKKFMLKAKIRALEEYVQHLEKIIYDQTTYIDYLERKKTFFTLKRWNSI